MNIKGEIMNGGNQSGVSMKLVGIGQQGKMEASALPTGDIPFRMNHTTNYLITNPNDSNDINVNQVLLIDGEGNNVYAGPLVRLDVVNWAPVRSEVSVIAPHQTLRIGLSHYMWTGGNDTSGPAVINNANWLNVIEAGALAVQPYTFQIEWNAPGNLIPLKGWQQSRIAETTFQNGQIKEDKVTWMESQMVNLD
jgi:hypothetical protein